MNRAVIVFTVCTLSACAANNQITQIIADDLQAGRVEEDGKWRFTNLYPDVPAYPYTCEEECYQPSAQLECQHSVASGRGPDERDEDETKDAFYAESCTYTGSQQIPLDDTGFSVQWLGHASFHIQTASGHSILLDPVSGQFDWPVNWAFRLSDGFNRQEPEWLSDRMSNEVDIVAYSHIHYDHYNEGDIASLGTSPDYLVPSGFAGHFPSGGYRLSEMDWFAHKTYGELEMHFVPAHHFSSRIWVPYLYEDENTTLWGGWVMEVDQKRLFFAGDTGYSAHFSDIRERYGEMDVCLIPIASYHHAEHGDWYRYVHLTPEDALAAADMLACRVMIPWGYGNSSWKMGDHSSHSALTRLLNVKNRLSSETPLLILNEGDRVKL